MTTHITTITTNRCTITTLITTTLTVSTDDLVFDESQTGVTNYAQQDFSGGFDVTKAKIELNLQTQRQLPYIQIRDPPLKLSEYDFSVIYKKGKSNANADALSRIEIHAIEATSSIEQIDEINSLTGNPSESILGQPNSSTETVHTSVENPILEIPITDEPLNKFNRQICFTIVNDIKKRPVVTRPFDTHTRISIQLSESNLEEEVTCTVKEYVNPKVKRLF